MKKLSQLCLTFILLIFFSNNCAMAETESDYTLMIYMNGSSLESSYDYAKNEFRGFATKDLQEMIDGYQENAKINIIVQTSGTKKWNNSYISNEETQRFSLGPDGFELDYSLPLQNVGYKKGLSDFIIWTHRNFPSKKYALILWNHGGGPIGGFGYDENFNGDRLHLEELEGALETAKSKTNMTFDLIGFDACLMASIEVASTLVPYADIMIGSENIEPSHGWDYTSLLNELYEESNMSGEKLGQIIADGYLEQARTKGKENNVTLSVIDLSKINDIIADLDTLLKQSTKSFDDVRNFYDFAKAAAGSRSFGANSDDRGYTDLIDLKDFASRLNASLATESDSLSEAIDTAVLYKVDGPYSKNTGGLSIYFPIKDKKYYKSKLSIYNNSAALPYYKKYLKFFNSKMTTLIGDGNISYKVNQPNSKTDFYHLLFSEEEYMKISTVYLSAYTLTEEDDLPLHTYRSLGYDDLIFYDEGDYLFNEQFNKEWIHYGAQPLLLKLLRINNETYEYESPVLYNGEKMYLQFQRQYNEETLSEDFQIYGLRRSIDPTTGKPDKEIYNLLTGDSLTPLYRAYNERRKKFEWIEGSAISITEDTQLAMQELLADEYALQFRFTDFSYKTHRSSLFKFLRY